MVLRFKLLWLLVFGIGLLVLVCGWAGYWCFLWGEMCCLMVVCLHVVYFEDVLLFDLQF